MPPCHGGCREFKSHHVLHLLILGVTAAQETLDLLVGVRISEDQPFRVTQWLECLVYTQNVVGSSPIPGTIMGLWRN